MCSSHCYIILKNIKIQIFWAVQLAFSARVGRAGAPCTDWRWACLLQREPCTALSALVTLSSVWPQAPADWTISDQRTGTSLGLKGSINQCKAEENCCHFAMTESRVTLASQHQERTFCFNFFFIAVFLLLCDPADHFQLFFQCNQAMSFVLAGRFIWLCTSTWCSWRREDAPGQLWNTASWS